MFCEDWPNRPKLIRPLFWTLPPGSAEYIESTILLDQVKAVVWAYGGYRAPGPDRFTFKFVKKFWSIISEDVMKVIRHFEAHGTLARGCNSSFIRLVAKKNDPTLLCDYRPVSLIGAFYKIIKNVHATRMKSVITNKRSDW